MKTVAVEKLNQLASDWHKKGVQAGFYHYQLCAGELRALLASATEQGPTPVTLTRDECYRLHQLITQGDVLLPNDPLHLKLANGLVDAAEEGEDLASLRAQIAEAQAQLAAFQKELQAADSVTKALVEESDQRVADLVAQLAACAAPEWHYSPEEPTELSQWYLVEWDISPCSSAPHYDVAQWVHGWPEPVKRWSGPIRLPAQSAEREEPKK